MVRVISVHHFISQNVQTVEQPTAATVAPPNRLLLALTSNCIEVRDLENDSEIQFTFPTVDESVQIIHCLNGDYVASLEKKFNRQNREINFARVYLNWDSVAALQQSKMTSSNVSLGSSECGMVQPMRARIAGRVTPTINQSELGSLEMIEIPVKQNPNAIACCQMSGNLAILSNNLINIYKFQIRTHDISKLKFIDFEELSIFIELSFTPFDIQLAENYIAVVSSDNLHVFRILTISNNGGCADAEQSNRKNVMENDFSFLYTNDEPLDFTKLKQEEKNNQKCKLTINLPTIVRENSLVHKHSPFTFTDKDIIATVRSSSSFDNKSDDYKIQNLIQLKLISIVIENNQKKVSEEFKSMIMKPLYIDSQFNKKIDLENYQMQSSSRKCLNSIAFMIATQQEGYLYLFNDSDESMDKDNCIAVYPFTSPVYKIIMEDYFLHALTETGLESYTLRIGHQLCRNFDNIDNNHVAFPSIDDSICLVGLRPFLGVERLFLSQNYLILLASADGSSPVHSVSSSGSSTASFLTLYNLELPSPKVIFNDISIVANVVRFTSSQTYCHLISEAHMILRMALMLKKWTMSHQGDDTTAIVKLIMEKRDSAFLDDIAETYKLSCALLGDHYIMCPHESSYTLAIPYYNMAMLHPVNILNRVKTLQEQHNTKTSKGLIHYLKHTLLEIKTSYDADRYFGPAAGAAGSRKNFSETMLELFECQDYIDLPNLILKCKILREYSTDKLINILLEKCSKQNAQKNLALCILYLQKCNETTKAYEYLRKIEKQQLINLLLEYWELLLDTSIVKSSRNSQKSATSFSELTSALISIYPEILPDLFVTLIVDKKVINLSKMFKVFLEYLPSSIGKDGNFASTILQQTLENFFTRYFSKEENIDVAKVMYEKGATEALKLLVRSYLSQLQMLQLKKACEDLTVEEEDEINNSIEDELNKDTNQEKLQYNHIYKTYFDEQETKRKDDYLFADLRYQYLDQMPPFQKNLITNLYEKSVNLVDELNTPIKNLPQHPEADLILKKIQALLCSNVVPKQIIIEVNGFLSVNEDLRGADSLRSITMNVSDAVLLLIDLCPQCLLQLSKDRFTRGDDWKFLIASLQRRILKLSQKDNLQKICVFYQRILQDILTHAAASFSLDQLYQIFPQKFSKFESNDSDHNDQMEENKYDNFNTQKCQIDGFLLHEDIEINNIDCYDILKDIQNYDAYIDICKNNQKANEVNKMLTNKAQQLLNTLNL